MYEMVEFVKTEFGDVDGTSVDCCLNQRLMNLHVFGWIQQHGHDRVNIMSRNTDTDKLVNFLIGITCSENAQQAAV